MKRATAALLDAVMAALVVEAHAQADSSPTGLVWRAVADELSRLGDPQPVNPARLPVCDWLPENAVTPLANMLLNVLPSLSWARNSSYDDADFLARYGYCELVGEGPWLSSHVRVGVLLLAPHTHYALHAHPAEEIYWVLHGAARWWVGSDEPRAVVSGDTVHHPPEVAHAMCTAESALLALYCWCGAIGAPARLLERNSARNSESNSAGANE